MRRFLFLYLLLTVASVGVRAQDAGRVVLASLENIVNPTNTDKLVWLDDDTLIFEPPPDEPRRFFAYEYHVSSGQVERIEPSPLYFEPTEERITYYQMDTLLRDDSYNSYRSPFYFPSISGEVTQRSVIYNSSLHIGCTSECSADLIMAGGNADPMREDAGPLDILLARTYHALDFYGAGSLRVYWARAAQRAVVDVNPALGIASRLYLVDLRSVGFQARPSIYIGDVYAELPTHFYALADDGTCALYSYPKAGQSGENLILWQMIPAPDDAPWKAEVLPERIFMAENDDEDPFAGANFIPDDEHHIVALHTDGIVRIDVETDERVVLNPDINAQWIKLGVFSPDNRHIVVVTRDNDVIVMLTNIE